MGFTRFPNFGRRCHSTLSGCTALTSVFVIGFGDNHGQISGVGLGTVMDYEGRYIDIDEKDFVVFTEQNR